MNCNNANHPKIQQSPNVRRRKRTKNGNNSMRSPQQGVRGSGGRDNAVVLNTMPIFQSSVRRRLTYYGSGNLTTTSGVLNTTVFSANGLYDPDISGIGHQPTGFDQMMVFYDHYVVQSCRATVNWYNASSSGSAQVALSLNSSSSVPSDYTSLAEGGYIVRDFINFAQTSDAIKTSRLFVNIPKFTGITNVRDATDLWGTISSNPQEQTYFNLSAWDFQGGTALIRYEILLEFDAWFLEPRKLTTSLTTAIRKAVRFDEMKITVPK